MAKILFSVIIIVTISACKNSYNEAALGSVNKTLIAANEAIADDNRLLYVYMEGALRDPQTKMLADIWEPRTRAIKEVAKDVNKYIKNLMKTLKEAHKDNAAIAVTDTGDLYNRVVEYNKQIATTITDIKHLEDSVRKIKAKNGMQKEETGADSAFRPVKDTVTFILENALSCAKEYAANRNYLLGLTMLSKLQNDALLTENALLTYCKNNATYNSDEVKAFEPLAILDRSYVKAGQYIEVVAGVGVFYVSEKTVVKINDRQVPLNPNGMATYSFIATGKPGRYQMPLFIEFEEQDGTQSIVYKKIKYTILK